MVAVWPVARHHGLYTGMNKTESIRWEVRRALVLDVLPLDTEAGHTPGKAISFLLYPKRAALHWEQTHSLWLVSVGGHSVGWGVGGWSIGQPFAHLPLCWWKGVGTMGGAEEGGGGGWQVVILLTGTLPLGRFPATVVSDTPVAPTRGCFGMMMQLIYL